MLEELAAGLEDHLADALTSADASRVANDSDETAQRRGRGFTALDAAARDFAAPGSQGTGHTAGAGACESLHSLGISVESSFDVVLGLVRALVVQQAEENEGTARTALDTMNVRPFNAVSSRLSVTLLSSARLLASRKACSRTCLSSRLFPPPEDGRAACLGVCKRNGLLTRQRFVQALLVHLKSIGLSQSAAPGATSKQAAAGSSGGSKFVGFSDASLDQFMVLLAQLATRGPASVRSEAVDGLVQLALLRGRCAACVRACLCEDCASERSFSMLACTRAGGRAHGAYALKVKLYASLLCSISWMNL